MSIGALIKSLFKAIIPSIIVYVIAGLILAAVLGGDLNFYVSITLLLVIYTMGVMYCYNEYGKQSTCPRCKTPFVYYEKCVGSETLSEDYISKDVKDSDGIYRRKSYKVGKERNYYEAKCKECGHTKERQAVSSFKREV